MFRVFSFLSILAVTVIFAGLMNCSDSGPDWNERCREAIEGGTYEEILDNCSYLGYAELSSSQRFTVGIMALQENDPDNARIYFEDIESTAGEYGSAQYGIMLAELQKIMRMLNVLLQFYIEYPSTVFGFLQEIRPQAEEPDMFFPAQASDYLSIEVIRDLQERAFTAVQNGYSIEVEEYPVFIGSESDRVYLRYLFTGKQGELGALLYWLFSDVFIAASNYASAHNTSLDLGGLLNDRIHRLVTDTLCLLAQVQPTAQHHLLSVVEGPSNKLRYLDEDGLCQNHVHCALQRCARPRSRLLFDNGARTSHVRSALYHLQH